MSQAAERKVERPESTPYRDIPLVPPGPLHSLSELMTPGITAVEGSSLGRRFLVSDLARAG